MMSKLKFKECENCREWNGNRGHCADICSKPYAAMDGFNRYMELEEQGLLLQLPCKVGDEYWVIAYRSEKAVRVKCTGYTIQKDVLNKINHAYIWVDAVESQTDYWKLSFEQFENQCFKTREEAEAALAEMKTH